MVANMTLQDQIQALKEQLLKLESANPARESLPTPPPAPLKLDLGCGNGDRKAQGFTGVDIDRRPGVEVVCDLGRPAWPWADSSVDEVMCSHMLEHIPAKDLDFTLLIDWDKRQHHLIKHVTRPRITFFNELYRVMKNGAKAVFITPHWCSARAFGDITHEWPAVCEMFWMYLSPEWRKANTPHLDEFKCDFTATFGYSLRGDLGLRSPEHVQHALMTQKEAAQDMQTTLVCNKKP
jgi:SAM-dependent methyltransferase